MSRSFGCARSGWPNRHDTPPGLVPLEGDLAARLRDDPVGEPRAETARVLDFRLVAALRNLYLLLGKPRAVVHDPEFDVTVLGGGFDSDPRRLAIVVFDGVLDQVVDGRLGFRIRRHPEAGGYRGLDLDVVVRCHDLAFLFQQFRQIDRLGPGRVACQRRLDIACGFAETGESHRLPFDRSRRLRRVRVIEYPVGVAVDHVHVVSDIVSENTVENGESLAQTLRFLAFRRHPALVSLAFGS